MSVVWGSCYLFYTKNIHQRLFPQIFNSFIMKVAKLKYELKFFLQENQSIRVIEIPLIMLFIFVCFLFLLIPLLYVMLKSETIYYKHCLCYKICTFLFSLVSNFSTTNDPHIFCSKLFTFSHLIVFAWEHFSLWC